MRWLAALCLACLLGGCLYVSDRNHAPVASIDAPLVFNRCGDLPLKAQVEDPDGDEVASYAWSVQVESDEPDLPGRFDLTTTTGWPLCPAGSASIGLERSTAATSAHLLGTWKDLTLQRLPLRGTYHVELVLRDTLGAESRFTAQLTTTNRAPRIDGLVLEADPAVQTDSFDAGRPAHAHYLARITGLVDVDDDPSCTNHSNQRTWAPVGRTLDDFEYWEPVCDLFAVPLGGVRLKLRPDRAQAGALAVRVTAKDGAGGIASKQVGLEVRDNRPACIRALEPYVGVVKLPAAQPNTFSISSVQNDVPQPVEYSWLVKDQGSSAFSLLALQQSSSITSLTLPAWFRSPGQRVELRVSIHEEGGPAPDCAESEASCEAAGMECYRWVTWSIEFQ